MQKLMLSQAIDEQGVLIQDVVRRKADEHAVARENSGAEMNIGARLHEVRKSRKLTLQDISKATGVSASAFSKIERNELSPTIGTLQRIAQGIGVDLMELLNDQSNSVPAYGRRSITRAGHGKQHDSNTCANHLLCSDLRNKKMTPIMTYVSARSTDDYKAWAKSEAEIFLTVLEGTLVVHSKLYEPLVLNEGDSYYYDANVEHAWTSAGETDAKVLWVLALP
ncbi:helix-turn-helix domain-containing protein [Neorhizobium alkalisoli]|jgi:DNA-binding XRE family transcriptional regulator|uniref:XRE family transcriptional regulator n=1 Tax=Neorhizobium alkalisoli TaxID=528178 RepID=A0A561R856_9HYPH|nr:XRE family transcriptional regulator [Neorhizobium alkalisoli]TWF58801.1 XRE family transcriptional regulator [Neorhizobium alkalisoli]